MAIRLIIEGNSVYEIDEECECTRKSGMENRRRNPGAKERGVSGAENDRWKVGLSETEEQIKGSGEEG